MYRLFFVLLLSINFLYAKITISEGDTKIDNFNILYYYDKSQKLSIDQIKQIDFTKQIDSQFTLGYLSGNNWFKIEIENKSDKDDFVLYFTEPYFDQVNLYSLKNNTWIKKENGISIPLKNREIYHHNPAFEIKIKKNETKSFYIQTYNKVGNFAEFQIFERKSFYTYYELINTLLYLLYFGGLFIVVVLNLFLFIKLKDKIYIYYVGYTTSFILFISLFSGLNLYLGFQPYYYEFHISTALFVLFLLLFSAQFLEIKKYNKTLKRVFDLFALFFSILAVLLLSDIDPWYEMLSSTASIMFILLSGSAIYVWIKGHKTAKYYIFALSFYLITISLMSSVANGWLENNDINRYSFLIGSYIEIIFFSLMLTQRFNSLQNQRLDMQKELIEITQRKELVLQKEIDDRTKEIVELLEEKDLLLKEVYHRVKNNFQILIGIIWMEEDKIIDKDAKNIFPDFVSRISSMALVHRLLYESDNLTKIDSNTYINKIISQYSNIDIKTDISNIQIKMDDAISLGMIINEAINNSIKYNNNDNLHIDLKLSNDDKYSKLSIVDNGKGFNLKNTKEGLGLNLIKQFSNKLKNSILTIDSDNGVNIQIIFELTKGSKL